MPLIVRFMPDGQDRPLDIFHPVGQHRRREVPVVRLDFVHMLKESLFLLVQRLGDGILNRPHQRVDARAEILVGLHTQMEQNLPHIFAVEPSAFLALLLGDLLDQRVVRSQDHL